MLNRTCHQSVLPMQKTDKTDSSFELLELQRSTYARGFDCRKRAGEVIELGCITVCKWGSNFRESENTTDMKRSRKKVLSFSFRLLFTLF